MGGRMTIAAERDQIAFHHPRRSGYEILCDGLRGLSWNRTTDSASHLAVVPAPPDNIFPYQRRTLEDPGEFSESSLHVSPGLERIVHHSWKRAGDAVPVRARLGVRPRELVFRQHSHNGGLGITGGTRGPTARGVAGRNSGGCASGPCR